jgi:hypothetical protein
MVNEISRQEIFQTSRVATRNFGEISGKVVWNFAVRNFVSTILPVLQKSRSNKGPDSFLAEPKPP